MAAVDQINRGSQQQAAGTHEASVAVVQIEQSAAGAKHNAELANGRVAALDAALKDSRSTIERLVGGVRHAMEQTEASLAHVVSLDAASRRIDKMAGAIGLVAVQISMLAVSGAVEAARAGESGRGFAVVSSDIRSLARESSDNADRINDTVDAVTGLIGSVRRDIEQIVGLSAAEVQKNLAISETLGRLDGEVTTLGAANTAILHSAGEILTAVAQAAAGARQIAAAAEEASAASRQAAATAAEQAHGAEELAAAIEEIASLADELSRRDA